MSRSIDIKRRGKAGEERGRVDGKRRGEMRRERKEKMRRDEERWREIIRKGES